MLNAANEVAVHAFLSDRLGFMGIPAVIEATLEQLPAARVHSFDTLYHADAEARAGGGGERRGARLSWLLAFLGFAALIILHEAGHFAAAKAVGMRVERFSLFFPPLLARVRRGETEYAIGSVPLGGYVKITGMNPAEEIPPEVAHRAYYRQPVWKRIVVIAAGPAVNIVLAFLLLMVIFLGWGVYDGSSDADRGRRRDEAAPAQVLKPGDRVVAVDGKRGDIDALRDQIATHRCAGAPGRRLQGRRARARHRDPRRPRADVLDHARLRGRRRSARCVGFSCGGEVARRRRRRGRAS